MRQVMRRGGFLLLVMCAASTAAWSQAAPPVVETRTVLATDAGHSGSTVEAAVEAEIASGYHINDHHPSLDYLIPTELKLDPSKQVSVEKVVSPKGEPQKFAFADEPLSVYEGNLVVGEAQDRVRTRAGRIYPQREARLPGVQRPRLSASRERARDADRQGRRAQCSAEACERQCLPNHQLQLSPAQAPRRRDDPGIPCDGWPSRWSCLRRSSGR